MTTTESRAVPLTTGPTAWLCVEVAELRAELVRLRTELATEVRTQRIVVVDVAAVARTVIEPGRVTVEHERHGDNVGSRAEMSVTGCAAEIRATADFPGGLYHDEVIAAVLYAGSEMQPAGEASACLRAGTARQTRVVTEPEGGASTS